MGFVLAFSGNAIHCPLPLFSPVPASRLFYGFLPQSPRVISWKFMAIGLTNGICSPKPGCVQKSIRKIRLLPYGGQIGNSANKAENPKSYRPNILPGSQSWDPTRVFGVQFEVGSPGTSSGELGARYALGVLNGDEISLSEQSPSDVPAFAVLLMILRGVL